MAWAMSGEERVRGSPSRWSRVPSMPRSRATFLVKLMFPGKHPNARTGFGLVARWYAGLRTCSGLRRADHYVAILAFALAAGPYSAEVGQAVVDDLPFVGRHRLELLGAARLPDPGGQRSRLAL